MHLFHDAQRSNSAWARSQSTIEQQAIRHDDLRAIATLTARKKTNHDADFWATAASHSTKVAALFASTSRAPCLMDMPN
ncbi:hypothetical protein [Stutzerimonas chloritidismutans]|uniref:Uncharacterized protein n=1 Tax=Stutzerimonas chloritidismutans TaxID=203192 RepID=A0ABU9M8V6_STUCH